MAKLIIFAAATQQHEGAHEAAATHASTEAHGGAAEHAEPTALGLSATVWVSLAMLLLIAVMLWKKVPAMIGKMLDDKIAGIRQQLDEAAALRSEAEALRNEYAAKLAALDGEAAAIKARAEEEAAALVKKTEADSKELIARRQRMAEDRIGAAERAAVADVREQATRGAVAAAAALIADKHDGKADQALVDRAIADLGRA
jgi:F-type H+-transporting ATPase subunit b